MPIRSIFLLLFSLSFASAAEPIHATFEVLTSEPEYLDVMQKKAFLYRSKELDCYILKRKTDLSLRCNDVNTTEALNETIMLLENENIPYNIIDLDAKAAAPQQYKPAIPFYAGYNAYDRGEYKKAESIFLRFHNEAPTFESAYALALVASKRQQFAKLRDYMIPYLSSEKKARKLYRDSIINQMYATLKQKSFDQARALIARFETSDPSLKRYRQDIALAEASELVKSAAYAEAHTVLEPFVKISKKAKAYDFEIDYVHALALLKADKEKEALALMQPYVAHDKRASDFLRDMALKRAGELFGAKAYNEARAVLAPFIARSKKAKSLDTQIAYRMALDLGWAKVKSAPAEALEAFESACAMKKSSECLEGKMYAAFNAKNYLQAALSAQELYHISKKDAPARIAMQSALKMNDYKRAQFWYDRLEDKTDAPDPYKLSAMVQIDEAIAKEAYGEAMQIVDYLLLSRPNDIDMLQKRVELQMRTQSFQEAKASIAQLQQIDPQNRYAYATLAALASIDDDCEDALEQLSHIKGYTFEERQLSNLCGAKVALKARSFNKAANMIENVESNRTKSDLYTLMARTYEEAEIRDSIRAYQKALSYNPGDFDTTLFYLYRLKDFQDDTAFERAMQKAKALFNDGKQQATLAKLEGEYERSRMFSYYKNERYELCYRYGNVVSEHQHSLELDRMHAWCAYHSGEYARAQTLFATINHRYGQSAEDGYAFALSAYRNRDFNHATEALNRIEADADSAQALLIASLYMDLGKQEHAKALLETIPASAGRDELLLKVNKSYMAHKNPDLVAAGLIYKRRSGTKGLHWLEQYVLPLDLDYHSSDNVHWYADGDILYLYDGFLKDRNGTYLDFGLKETNARDDIASDIGFKPTVGVNTSYFTLELGSTPLGAKIAPEPTWLAEAHGNTGDWGARIAFKQEGIDESMVSFVGERSVRDSLEVNWGRVMRRGFEAGLSYDSEVTFSFDLGWYPWIHGLNVIDNEEFKLTSSAIYHSRVETLSFVDFGLVLVYDTYSRNSDLFTYGHGGYFSPQDFWLGSFVLDIGDQIGPRSYWRLKSAVGFEGYIVDDAFKYPLQDLNDPELGGVAEGYRSGGVTYKIALGGGYHITDTIDLSASAAFEKMYSYEMFEAGFSLTYRFKPEKRASITTLKASHGIEAILK